MVVLLFMILRYWMYLGTKTNVLCMQKLSNNIIFISHCSCILLCWYLLNHLTRILVLPHLWFNEMWFGCQFRVLILLYSPVLAGNFSATEKYTMRYAGAAAMYFVSKKLKKKYNITDERAALYEAAETWVDALDGRDFLGLSSSCHLDT